MSITGDYDIDEFEQLMQQSRSGGRDLSKSRRRAQSLRLCRSLPSSPLSSPKRSPEADEAKADVHADFQAATDATTTEQGEGSDAVYTNLLCPPDPFQELQGQFDGSTAGARPKLARMSTSPSRESITDPGPSTHGIRRTQSCRRPASSKRYDQNQYSYRQRAHANAWRQHANQASTDEELESGDPNAEQDEIPAAQSPTEPEFSEDDEPLQDCKIYRVRSFRTTNSGIVNKGDSFKIKSRRQSSKHQRRGPHGRRMSTDTTMSYSSVSREDLVGDSPATLRNYPIPDPEANPQSTSHTPASLPLQEVNTTNCLSPYDVVQRSEENATVPQGWERQRTPSMDRGIPVGFMFEGGLKIDEDSAEGAEEDEDDEDSKVLKVIVLGMNGVGKRTLTRQLLTSEYLANTDRYQDDDQENVKIVSVMLDDEESVVQFIDARNFQEAKAMDDIDAYIIVYSVTDRNSFAFAHACLQDLTKKGASSRRKVLIVVGNKQDCVRNRVISEQEGRSLASHRHCKYTEVSALLDHKIDELLVGILRQIRLNQANVQRVNSRPKSPTADSDSNQKRGCLQKAALGIFRRLFRKRSRSSGHQQDSMLL